MKFRKLDYTDMMVLVFALVLAMVGIGVAVVLNEPDTQPEEAIEAVIESIVEEEFGLPEDALRNKIDLTPGSPEEK